MRFSINKFALVPAVLAAATLVSPSAASASPATVKVPFGFNALGKTMPAGDYIVEEGAFHNLVVLRNKDTSKAISWVLGPGDPEPSDKHVSLKFDEIGSTHVLKSIQFGSQIAANLDKHYKEGKDNAYVPTRLSQGR